MKKILGFVIVVGCIATLASVSGAFTPVAGATNTATQNVSFSVAAITGLSVSGNPAGLNITGATDGSDPDNATDATTTYNVTTNSAASKKITASISSAMPTDVTLQVQLGGNGIKTLGTTSVDVVTGLSKTKQSGTITYTLSALATAGEVTAGTSRTVTFTIVNAGQ
jgi:hypothetical protein